MSQFILDDTPTHNNKNKLRTPLLEKIEMWTLITALLLILYTAFHVIVILEDVIMLIEPIGVIFIIAYLILWKKASIAFDNDSLQNLFLLSDSLQTLKNLSIFVLLWKIFGGGLGIYIFLLEENRRVLNAVNLSVLIFTILGITLAGLGFYYLFLTKEATKYINKF